MELRPDISHKENVPPRPATPLRPEKQRVLKSLGVGLASRHGRCVPVCQAERGGPAATPSLGTALRQEPCQVQTNLAGPGPSLGLALKDTTGRLINSSFQQQSNLQPLAWRPQGRAQEFAIQQSNLSIRETSVAECGRHTSPCLWLEPQESWPNLRPWGSPLSRGPLDCPSSSLRRSRLLATDTRCPDVRPTAGLAPLNWHTQPGLRSRCGLGGSTSRIVGEPLSLEDLAVPAWSRAWAPSQAAIHQLLASVRRLEHEAAGFRCQASREPPGPVQREPWTSAGQAVPAHPQPSQPVLASCNERKKHSGDLRGTVGFPETPGVQDGLSDSQASSKPARMETTLQMLPGDALDPEQGVLGTHRLRRGKKSSPGTTYGRGRRGDPLLSQGVGSREASLCSLVSCSSAWDVLPGQEGGEGTPWEQISKEGERLASSWFASSWQWASRCFRGWRRLVQRRQAVVAAVALGRRQLLPKGLRALRWALWLREPQMEAASGRHMQVLLNRAFQKWRNLTQQQKHGQPHVQAGPGPPPSRGGQDQGFSGRKPVVDAAQRNSPGSLREEAGARPVQLHSGLKPDGGNGAVQILHAVRQLAGEMWGAGKVGQTGQGPRVGRAGVFLLWCHQKEWAMQEKEVQAEASQATVRTQRRERPPQAWCSPAAHAAWVAPLDTQRQTAWLCRCFGAWQRFVQRGTQYRNHVASRRVGTLRVCLQQWVQMKQLQASDGAKVTQLSLCRQKAGNTVLLLSSAPGRATACGLGVVGLPQEQGQASLKEACRRLALHRTLLLWRTRLSQRQQADSFFQEMQRRVLRHILRGWRLRAQDPGRTTLVPEPLGGILGEEAWRGCNTPHSSLEKAPRASALLEILRMKFLWAAGRRQQERCLVLWQARAQQSRSTARWHRSILQRRILLGWSHWATAQGAQRELAACWAWDRSCRATLGLWRQRLVQRREAEQWAQEWGRRLEQRALGHWHSCWQRQQLLGEKYQRWVQVRLQGLRRAVLRGWRQAAARRRRAATGPEQLLLQSPFQARFGVMRDTGMPWAKHPAFQDGPRRRALEAASATWWEVPVTTAEAQKQRGARASFTCWSSRHVQGCQVDRQLRRARAHRAPIAGQAALGQCFEARQQAEERARAQALCWTLWVRESCLHQAGRAHTAWKLSARCGLLPPPSPHSRVLEAWAQSAAQGRVQRTSVTQFQQAGPRAHPRPRADVRHWLRLATRGHLLVLMTAPAPGKGKQARPGLSLASARPQDPGGAGPGQWLCPSSWPWGCHDTLGHQDAHQGLSLQEKIPATLAPGGTAPPAPGLPAGPAPGSDVAALGRCSGGRAAGADTAQAVAPEMGVENVAAASPAAAGGSAIMAAGSRLGPLPVLPCDWFGNKAWLVAGLLSHAFEKWHQRLAARGQWRGATSSPRLLNKAGISGPGSRQGAARAPARGGLGAEQGAQLQL
ncbi:LOW QUALITY PROTEIN: uncharacterized protein C1orf167 homolog [Camelus dromedarius]|uniref:LOW QUALITY PROTEIN: uncharacterized protein C1orf167 homolog n=1 Tax=Camelus dromedarius TaxID=9838 RepID=UPI0031192BB3